jgi:hypothetical protein
VPSESTDSFFAALNGYPTRSGLAGSGILLAYQS